jgi:hypothetical protein
VDERGNDAEFRFPDLGGGVWGVGCGVWGLGLRVADFVRIRDSDFGLWVLRCRIKGVRLRVLVIRVFHIIGSTR